jgi:predicted nucleic acid-binding protein
MPKNILVDLNVILDILLKRQGFEASKEVLLLHEMSGSKLFISGHMVTTFAYLLENAGLAPNNIKYYVEWLLDIFSVVPTNENILHDALENSMLDYEDAVVEQTALSCKAPVIVTRNLKDFAASRVPAASPETLLKDRR